MPVVTSAIAARHPSPIFRPAPTDDLGVETPLWWVYRLSQRLARESVGFIQQKSDGELVMRDGMAKLARYYDGQFDLPFIRDPDVAAEYRAMLERSRSNFMRLVVNVPAERSRVIGLRINDENEDIADAETWDIWRRNDLDAWFPVGVQTALAQRRAYWSVWWGDGDGAKVALEDPQQVIVEHRPDDRTVRAAGLKMWLDDWTGETYANLALPDAIYRFRWGPPPGRPNGTDGWYERAEPLTNPLGVVPYVPMVNHPDLHHVGVSEIEDVIPVQDRINQTLFNRQVAEHLSAFRQKWATGLEIPEVDGEAIEPYKAAIDKLWVSPDSQSRFGQFDATDLTNYHRTIEQDLEHLSVLTRTPRHVFMHQGQAPSGDAMKSDEAGLVAKVKGQWSSFGPAMLEVLALARQVEGMTTPLQSEIVWADPEWQTFGQLVDGIVKLKDARMVSARWGREKLGMTVAEMRRVEAEILEEDLLGFEDPLFAPPAPADE